MKEEKEYIKLPGIQTVSEDECLEKAYLQEGIKIGILDVARRMIEKEMDIHFISELTGYSIEKIDQFKEILREQTA
jgi:hypothetical protein